MRNSIVSAHRDLAASVLAEIRAARPPKSIAAAFDILKPTNLGMEMRIPILKSGARMFRIRQMSAKPTHIREIEAPPVGIAPLQRLNDQGQSVFYLADSPDTAFAEARSAAGEYCLSEWRTNQQKIALVNGGFDRQSLARFFPSDFTAENLRLGGVADDLVERLFADIFTLSAGSDPRMYWWSIACGQANGFSHACERTENREMDGNTCWTGRFPLAGIAYPSTRKSKNAVNFAWNDLGRTYLLFDHVQWVRRELDGSFTGLDIATSFSSDGRLFWANRAPNLVLQAGQSARVTKIAETKWSYENLDGTIPIFR